MGRAPWTFQCIPVPPPPPAPHAHLRQAPVRHRRLGVAGLHHHEPREALGRQQPQVSDAGACALHTRCVYWGFCVDRFSPFRGRVLLAPVLLPKTVPDTAEGTWVV